MGELLGGGADLGGNCLEHATEDSGSATAKGRWKFAPSVAGEIKKKIKITIKKPED